MSKPPQSFLSRNMVTIVMVPTIIALHFGWNSMQNNRSLVSESEQIDLPAVTFVKYLQKKISGTDDTAAAKSGTSSKAENS